METPIHWHSAPLGGGASWQLHSPFIHEPPHPWATEAAVALQAQLRAWEVAPGISVEVLQRPEGGKMFGVLVVGAADGRTGHLRAFSGQIGTEWELPGWVPPVFDPAARGQIEPAAERQVTALTERINRLVQSETYRDARAEFDAATKRHHADLEALRHRRREGKRDPVSWREEQALVERTWRVASAAFRRLERRRAAMHRLRRHLSRRAMSEIYRTYRFENGLGARATLSELFAPAAPPWGAGDCAAPKLLVFALRQRLRPLALAEFWWGPPPKGGGRVEGRFYPPCSAKCGPILPFLLAGTDSAQGGE